MGLLDGWERRARRLKTDTYTLYVACRDPRVPWYAKLLAACVVACAFSPIDLIPDFVPVLGYLDDLIIVSLGIALAVKMIPGPILEECQVKARTMTDRPANRVAAAVIIVIWLLMTALLITLIVQLAPG